jgi:hypothetical protein
MSLGTHMFALAQFCATGSKSKFSIHSLRVWQTLSRTRDPVVVPVTQYRVSFAGFVGAASVVGADDPPSAALAGEAATRGVEVKSPAATAMIPAVFNMTFPSALRRIEPRLIGCIGRAKLLKSAISDL